MKLPKLITKELLLETYKEEVHLRVVIQEIGEYKANRMMTLIRAYMDARLDIPSVDKMVQMSRHEINNLIKMLKTGRSS